MPRILIAEPSKTLAALVKLSLAELGAELEVTHDGAAALAAARARLPDALVCDQALPGLDGYGLAHSVKQLATEAGRAPIPVLLLVSEHAAPDPERLAYVGIGDVLPKPFERAVLLERVRALFDPVAPAVASARGAGPSARGAVMALPTVAPQPPTSPFMRPSDQPTSVHAFAAPAPTTPTAPMWGARAPEPTAADIAGLVGPEIARQVQAELEPLLAQRLPPLLDAALQRLVPGLVQATLERAVAERVPGIVEAAVQRAIGTLVTPTTIQRIVSEDARVVVGEVAQRIEGRLEEELLARLDRFAREVLPARLQSHAEQIIWKIVPTIAEDIVKDEIKRLTQELP